MDVRTSLGDGVMQAVKVVDGRPFALELHLDRLVDAARALGLDVPTRPEMREQVRVALAQQPLARGRLRLTLTEALAVTSAPLGEWQPTVEIVTAAWPRDGRAALAGLKTTSYVDNIVALARARDAGAGEAVFASTTGDLCEGTTSNVFFVLDGQLCTPTAATGCLPGVTRHLVLDWIGGREVDVPLEQVRDGASEVFLVSTTRDVQAVVRWDDRVLEAPGPVTRAALETWRHREPELLERVRM